MRSWMIACVLGLALPGLLPVPANPAWYAVLAFPFLLPQFRRLRLLAAFCLGFAWSGLYAWSVATSLLPESYHGKVVAFCGEITERPLERTEFTRFQLRPEAAAPALLPTRPTTGLVRLSWYGAPELHAGDRLCVHARLRAPRGTLNAGAFDSERWLIAQGVRASGHVVSATLQQREPGPLDRARALLRERILEADGAYGAKQLLLALTLGDRQGLEPQQRRALVRTGTAHLLAISGMHVGMVAGVAYLLLRSPLAWIGSGRQRAAQRAALAAALAVASGYAVLSGLGLPAQRALVMLLCATLPWLLGYALPLSVRMLFALLLILLWQPMAWLSAGLWLSFGAIAVLAYGFAGRAPGRPAAAATRAQWVVFVGLLPLLTWFGLPVSALAPLVNLLAIPLVGLLILPLGLLGLIVEPLFSQPLDWALWLLDWLDTSLRWAAAAIPAVLPLRADPALLLLAGLGLLLLLGPGALPARRSFAVLCCSALLLPAASLLEPGQWRAHVLDVGHGTAVLIETRGFRLLYDSGAGSDDGWNAGEAIIVPYLRAQGIGVIDEILISHADNDHRGGLAGLLHHVEVGRLRSNAGLEGAAVPTVPCLAGQQWQRDGVQFSILHPQRPGVADNNASCVLRVAGGGHSMLVTGDIERAGEHALLARAGDTLAAELLLAPHHGSLTSSSPAFVRAVQPRAVVYSSAWRGRFRLPHPRVAARYRRAGVVAWQTGKSGALRFDFRPDGGMPEPRRARARQRYWRGPDPSVERLPAVIELRRRAYWASLIREE